jgi:hypothetical protein
MPTGKFGCVGVEVVCLLSKVIVDKNEFMRLRNKLGDNEFVD